MLDSSRALLVNISFVCRRDCYICSENNRFNVGKKIFMQFADKKCAIIKVNFYLRSLSHNDN